MNGVMRGNIALFPPAEEATTLEPLPGFYLAQNQPSTPDSFAFSDALIMVLPFTSNGV